MLDCKIKFYFSQFILFKLLFSWVTFICPVFLHILMLQKCEFGYFWRHNLRYIVHFCRFQTLTKFEFWLNLRSIPEVHISLQLLAAPQIGADAGAGLKLWKGRDERGSERRRERASGGTGGRAGHQHRPGQEAARMEIRPDRFKAVAGKTLGKLHRYTYIF